MSPEVLVYSGVEVEVGQQALALEGREQERERYNEALMELASRISRALEDDRSPFLVSAYLFGSHSRERAHRESDVDVAVLLQGAPLTAAAARFEERIRLMGVLSRALGVSEIDLVVLNDAPPLLSRRIVTEGKRVFCSDPECDHAFVRDAQLRAADIQPFLDRMQRLKLEALAR